MQQKTLNRGRTPLGCKGVSVHNPNKCRRRKNCLVVKGKTRHYCRTRVNKTTKNSSFKKSKSRSFAKMKSHSKSRSKSSSKSTSKPHSKSNSKKSLKKIGYKSRSKSRSNSTRKIKSRSLPTPQRLPKPGNFFKTQRQQDAYNKHIRVMRTQRIKQKRL